MDSKKKGSILSVASIPAIWVIAITCGVASTGMGFLDPTMSPHLKDQVSTLHNYYTLYSVVQNKLDTF